MLSCVMKRSQTSRYSTRGSRRVSGGAGLSESTHTMPLSVWTTQAAMVRYSLTYPVTTPFTTRYAPGLQKQGGGGLCIFLFSSWTWSTQRKKGPSGDLVVKSAFPALANWVTSFQEWTLSTCAWRMELHEVHMHAPSDTHGHMLWSYRHSHRDSGRLISPSHTCSLSLKRSGTFLATGDWALGSIFREIRTANLTSRPRSLCSDIYRDIQGPSDERHFHGASKPIRRPY